MINHMQTVDDSADLAAAKAAALIWVRDFFPRWSNLAHKVRTVGELLSRSAGDLLRGSKGWATFEEGLREHLGALPARKLNKVIGWLTAQPLSCLETSAA
jgi:hypothetical protein